MGVITSEKQFFAAADYSRVMSALASVIPPYVRVFFNCDDAEREYWIELSRPAETPEIDLDELLASAIRVARAAS